MIGERELSPIYQGKGTLFANFPTKAVTGCFVFRPMVTNMAFLLLVQVKRFLAVANKTHLSIIRECFIFSKELWPKCAPEPWAAAPRRVGVAPRHRGADKSQSCRVKVKVLTPPHPNWQNVALKQPQFILTKKRTKGSSRLHVIIRKIWVLNKTFTFFSLRRGGNAFLLFYFCM